MDDTQPIPSAAATPQDGWQESDSEFFKHWGTYFVPERETQIRLLCDLIPAHPGPMRIVELCCGEGLLSGTLLERFPDATVLGLDGSQEMLRTAQHTLASFGKRFHVRLFALKNQDWRAAVGRAHTVLSSLAIHHLDDVGKKQLFDDVLRILEPGGVFLVADLIQPASAQGLAVAAEEWDEAVRQRSQEIAGNEEAFHMFQKERWNIFRYPDPGDQPSGLYEQLQWLEQAGFEDVDVHWMRAGHAIYGGRKGAAPTPSKAGEG